MNIILFGPPGAGKGTQGDKIVKNFNLYKVSTGDLLREEIKKNTNLGNKIKSIIDKGLLVSDNIINDLLIKIFSDKKLYNRLIFDGYPRNLEQARNLDSCLKKYNQKISCVLCLNVEKKFILKRILGRQTCINCGLILLSKLNAFVILKPSVQPTLPLPVGFFAFHLMVGRSLSGKAFLDRAPFLHQ